MLGGPTNLVSKVASYLITNWTLYTYITTFPSDFLTQPFYTSISENILHDLLLLHDHNWDEFFLEIFANKINTIILHHDPFTVTIKRTIIYIKRKVAQNKSWDEEITIFIKTIDRIMTFLTRKILPHFHLDIQYYFPQCASFEEMFFLRYNKHITTPDTACELFLLNILFTRHPSLFSVNLVDYIGGSDLTTKILQINKCPLPNRQIWKPTKPLVSSHQTKTIVIMLDIGDNVSIENIFATYLQHHPHHPYPINSSLDYIFKTRYPQPSNQKVVGVSRGNFIPPTFERVIGPHHLQYWLKTEYKKIWWQKLHTTMIEAVGSHHIEAPVSIVVYRSLFSVLIYPLLARILEMTFGGGNPKDQFWLPLLEPKMNRPILGRHLHPGEQTLTGALSWLYSQDGLHQSFNELLSYAQTNNVHFHLISGFGNVGICKSKNTYSSVKDVYAVEHLFLSTLASLQNAPPITREWFTMSTIWFPKNCTNVFLKSKYVANHIKDKIDCCKKIGSYDK